MLPAGVILTVRAAGEPNAGAVLLSTMVAFGPGRDAPGDVDDDATPTPPSPRPIMFENSEVEMRDHVGKLDTAADDAVDH